MIEPTYVFIKGEGWVVQTCPSIYFTLHNRRYVLEERRPVIGEFYFSNDDFEYPMQKLVDTITRYGYSPDDYTKWDTLYVWSDTERYFVYREVV